eukprot:gene13185-13316_t
MERQQRQPWLGKSHSIHLPDASFIGKSSGNNSGSLLRQAVSRLSSLGHPRHLQAQSWCKDGHPQRLLDQRASFLSSPPAVTPPASPAGACADSSCGFADGVLSDGGPTDRSLLQNAAVMTSSPTAAVVCNLASAPAAACEPLAQQLPPVRVQYALQVEPIPGASSGFVHEGILNCARAIRQDLDQLGLLDQLLLGHGSSSAAGAGVDVGTAEVAAQDQWQQARKGPDACCASAASGATAIGAAMSAAAPVEADAHSSTLVSNTPRPHVTVSSGGATATRQQLPDCRGWTLIITGHSLGAGVAALLALHFRCRYPRVRAWCFAPPGGLMSPAAAASLKDICYSVVSGKDMIPRMSLWTVERLRDEMMLCALRCKMPKYKLLMGAALGKVWEESDVLEPLPLQPAAAAQYRKYREEMVKERQMDPLRVRIAREFVPPGASSGPLKPHVPAKRAGLAAMAGSRNTMQLQPHATDGLSLIVGGMVVSRNMFADHVPDAQLAQLKRLVRRLQRQQQQQQQGQGIEGWQGSRLAKASTGWMGRALIRPPKLQQFEEKQQRTLSKQGAGNNKSVQSVQFTV